MREATERIVSADDRRAAAMEVLAEQVERLRSTDGWREWLAFASRLRRYSANNQLLIWVQRPDATVVMPYGRKDGSSGWRKVGQHRDRGWTTGADPVKALTLHQPWASLVAVGAKKIETRSWSTSYRGPLAIHAGKKRPRSYWSNIWSDQYERAAEVDRA